MDRKPLLAPLCAKETASRKSSSGEKRASEGAARTHSPGSSLSFSSKNRSARQRAGAVLFEQGSIKTVILRLGSSSKHWASTREAQGSLVTMTIESGPYSSRKRRTVFCKRETPSPKDKNCLGKLLRERGQRRVPFPPAKMTIFIKPFFCLFH